MIDREKLIKALECRKNADKRCGNPCEDTGLCHYATAVRGLDGEIYKPFICDRERICVDALALLKEQEAQKRKWLQTIADTQLAISPTGYESEDELAKRGWEWNGLQMAWEIIAGEERSEHPRLVRCKDCIHYRYYGLTDGTVSECKIDHCENPGEDWFCSDGERRME